MSLSTYAELQDAIAKWAKRKDLGPVLPEFVALAEERMAKDLRLQAQLVRTTLVVPPPGLAPLPLDWIEFADAGVKQGDRVLEYVTPDVLADYRISPCDRYSIQGRSLMLAPESAAPISLQIAYYGRIPALSDSNPTNWVLTNHPSLYLYGGLIEAAVYTDDAEKAGQWGALYDKARAALASVDAASRFNGARLRMRMR